MFYPMVFIQNRWNTIAAYFNNPAAKFYPGAFQNFRGQPTTLLEQNFALEHLGPKP